MIALLKYGSGLPFNRLEEMKERQKSCRRPECRKARKKAAQEAWVKKNQDYFADLYETYVKPWRKRKRMIKDEIRLKRVGARTFAAHGYG
jgi:hypothetical protein